jgi:ATP-binding cassette, subfamily F, member 3
MIQVDGLSIAYHGLNLFSEAKFSLQPKEKCGFVGRNGSGKSTLLRLITGKETSDGGSTTIRKHYRIGVLDQHIRFTKKTLIEEAALGLREGEEDCLYKAETILFGLGFTKDQLDMDISAFSGGYQLRVHLAKVLISEPDCLLLDEPTNYLDIVSIRWFTRFLHEWRGEFILISHDREFMDSVTTHTMGIHRQKIRKTKGSTVNYYEQLLLEEEIYEKTRQTTEKKRAQTQSFIDRFGAKASKAGQAQSRQKLLARIPVLEQLKSINNLDFEFNVAPFPGKKMIDVDQLSFSYGETQLINELSFTIEKGEIIAILGKNGRGKSTLLRLLAKELIPSDGTIKHAENLAIGYFGQTNIDRLNPQHTIEEEISLQNSTLNKTEVKSICGLMMFSGDQASKKTLNLSGGEKSRVLLGKIIAKKCNILFLDEPTHHLDMESIEALIDALETFDGSIILVTHSELILKRLNIDKIIVCHEGRQDVFRGGYDEFIEKDGWHDTESGSSRTKKSAAKPVVVEVESKPIEKRTGRSVKAIEIELSQKEGLVATLNKEMQQINEEMLQMISKNQSAKVQELSFKLYEKQQKIETLNKEIDLLFNELA